MGPAAGHLPGKHLNFKEQEYNFGSTHERSNAMKKATSQQFNLQDQKLNEARKAGQVVTITLMDGTKFTGVVSAFDLFTVAFITPNPEMDLLIYKHAISFIKFN
jgi:RNA chaperone Hfq